MVQPHCQISWLSFVRFTRGSRKPEAELLSHIMGFASRDFLKVKRWYHSKGTTNSSLGNFVDSPNSLITYGSHKEIPDRPAMVWTVYPSFFLQFYQDRLKIFDIYVEVFMQWYLPESVSFWIWLPVPQEVFPVLWFDPNQQPCTMQTPTPLPAGLGRGLKA